MTTTNLFIGLRSSSDARLLALFCCVPTSPYSIACPSQPSQLKGCAFRELVGRIEVSTIFKATLDSEMASAILHVALVVGSEGVWP